MNDEAKNVILEDYFTKIAERAQPIFIQYGWKIGRIPTIKDIVELLFDLRDSVDSTPDSTPCMSGRFLVAKDYTGNKIGYQVYFDLAEADWEY